MDYIYNVTFIITHDKETEFLDWMRTSALPMINSSVISGEDMTLRVVTETGGEKPGPEHGLSFAFQTGFPTEEMAHEWHDTVLPGVLGNFHAKFAPQAAFFITMLRGVRI